MLTRLVTELRLKPADLPIASRIEDWFRPKASVRIFFPESIREESAAETSPEPVAALAMFDTFTSDGASLTRRNIWLIEVWSLDRWAKLLISAAIVDSRPRETACPGSLRRDAISLMLLESSKLKSEENTELVIFHL